MKDLLSGVTPALCFAALLLGLFLVAPEWPTAFAFVATLVVHTVERVLETKRPKGGDEITKLQDRMGRLELRVGVRQ